jgi:hypothetical protein
MVSIGIIDLPMRRMTGDELLAWAERPAPGVIVRHGPAFEQERSEGAMFIAHWEALKRAALPCIAAVVSDGDRPAQHHASLRPSPVTRSGFRC